MKVFATLATLLGASHATPLIPQTSEMRMNQMSLRSDNLMRPSTHMAMNEVNRRAMDMSHHMSNQMSYQMPNQMLNQMSNQMSNMRNIYSDIQQALGPNQYFLKDTLGNYVYGYANQNSEKKEEGNGQSVQGTYTYIMSNGLKRRVDYIADDQGFHILRDNADSSRIKRSVDPDLINTRMTSFMDSSSLMDDRRPIFGMGQQRSFMNMMDQQRYSNMMDLDMMGRSMMGHNMMGRNMMGQNMMDQDMMGRNMMGKNMMENNMMDINMMDRNMMRNDIMGRRNNYNINQDSGIMRQHMSSNMIGRDMSSSMMRQGSDMMKMGAYATKGGLMGQQQMSQKMEMKRTPDVFTSTRFF